MKPLCIDLENMIVESDPSSKVLSTKHHKILYEAINPDAPESIYMIEFLIGSAEVSRKINSLYEGNVHIKSTLFPGLYYVTEIEAHSDERSVYGRYKIVAKKMLTFIG